MIGKTLRNYQITEKIGAGGQGTVYKATDAKLGRNIVIKVLPAELTAKEASLKRFEREARLASSLDHPNICTIFDLDEIDGVHFITMQHVEGKNVRQLVAGRPLELKTAVLIGLQVADALAAAHSRGIIHRDIKAGNVMVTPSGQVKVLDFGLAKLLDDAEAQESGIHRTELTELGVPYGTATYAAPEQARGDRVDKRADVFSMGVLLYEMLTGTWPFQGRTTIDVRHAVLHDPPSPISELRLSPIPPRLEKIVERALEKEPRDRFQNMEDFRDELRLVLQEIDSGSANLQSVMPEPPEHLHDANPVSRAVTWLKSIIKTESHTHLPNLTQSVAAPIEVTQVLQNLKREEALLTSPTSRHSRQIVGRERERDDMRAAFNRAIAESGILLCVAGEPGIGKTTLVEDFVAELSAENQFTIARGRCSERLAGTEAYLPLLEALDSLLKNEAGIGKTMRQLAPTWYAQVASVSNDSVETQSLMNDLRTASQERMKRELVTFLQAVAQAQPLVIFFDDLHWADVSTIDLLSFLAGKFDALHALILVTYRPSDMLLSKHPFLRIKPDLQARGLCKELLLEFLHEDEIAEYLELKFPEHRFPNQFPKLLHDKTEGSPLFMVDVVRYLHDRGVIAKAADVQDSPWTLIQTLPDIERELPESVRAMVERKIGQLAEEDRKLLTVASVQGYNFDSAVVAQVLGIDADEVEERLERLERVYAFVHVVNESEFPNRVLTLKYRFVHVLYQNSLYAALQATRRATLSHKVAQTIEDYYGGECANVANELALLWEASREYGRAADCFLLAAQNASHAFAHHEAATLGYRGLSMVKHLPDGLDRLNKELELQLVIGPAVMVTRGWADPEVKAIYSVARENCHKLGETEKLFPVITGLWNFYLLRADFASARELGQELLELAERVQEPALLVAAHWALVESSFWTADFEFVANEIQQVVKRYDFERDRSVAVIYGQDPWIICRCYDALRLLLCGYPEQALKTTEEVLTRARQLQSPFDIGIALLWATWVHIVRREPDPAIVLAGSLAAVGQEHGFVFHQTIAGIFRGWALCEQGEFEGGVAEFFAGLNAFRATGTEAYATFLEGLLPEVLGRAGRLAKGMELVDLAIGFAESKNERFYEPELFRVKGELLRAGGTSMDEVTRWFERAVELSRLHGTKLLELRASTSLARSWQQRGKLVEAKEMLSEIYNWFTEGFETKDLNEAKSLLNELTI